MLQSATKILGNLINDMLDYAHLSAGQFKKQMKKFDLVQSVFETIKVLRLKGDELGIHFEFILNGIKQDSPDAAE